MTFDQMFRDQRWDARKLNLLEAAGWACQECGLRVGEEGIHICFYPKGKMVWDYPSKAFKVLCAAHRQERAAFERQLRDALPAFTTNELGKLLDLLDELRAVPPEERLHTLDDLRAIIKREVFACEWDNSELEPLMELIRAVPAGRC
jgi:hypothetical protein